ncbi:MAG: GNAT family N-acetyltransferase [Clostridia bacterium]|nr:GNAT family N-acetyltransferase [Clostridia bacterium]
MTVLRAIDGYNFNRVIKLKVKPEQEDYVASNVFSLAQAYAMPECRPWAVYEGMDPVGFVMYALDADEHEYWIYRLMTDAAHQGKGYGRQALRLAIEKIRAEAGKGRDIYISFEPENAAARKLYESEGFVPDGRTVDGETVYRLDGVKE